MSDAEVDKLKEDRDEKKQKKELKEQLAKEFEESKGHNDKRGLDKITKCSNIIFVYGC